MKFAMTTFIITICMSYFAGNVLAETFTMKLGIVTQNDPIHVYIKEFKKRIEAKTEGRIKAEIYPGAQLGGTPRLIEGIQLGTIEMILLPPGFFKGVSPAFEATDAPGLFKNIDHAFFSLTDPEFRDKFLKIGETKGMVGVSLWVHGPTSYACLTPLRSLEDFKGKKFRVLATKVETELMKSIGATGVPMPFTEITPALQRKAIDGVRSNIMVLSGIKVFSVAKNITLVNDSMIAVVAMASKKFFAKLPPDLQSAVIEVGRDMEPYMLTIAKEYNGKAEEAWSKNGTIFRLSEEDRQVLMDKGSNIAENVLGKSKDTQQLFGILKKVAQKHE
jgi:TRAP-type C4-dicarboxylate transport system substrate-binding protein